MLYVKKNLKISPLRLRVSNCFKIFNDLFAYWASFALPPVRKEKTRTVVAVEMATGGDGDLDPLQGQVVAPLGAGRVGAGQGAPVDRLAVAAHSKPRWRK